MTSEGSFVPALGFKPLTPFYQTVVDVFNRDDHVKRLVLDCIKGERDMEILDMACGPGKLVHLLSAQQQCCRITGMDIDLDWTTRLRLQSEQLIRHRLNQTSVHPKGHPGGRFDL